MAPLDSVLYAFVTMNGIATSPVVLVVLAFLGAYLGARVVEVIPFTRRIIERRAAAQAAERE
jgi:xanthosine utilization system XapX-like protein